jgi:hypothetical protein
VLRERALAAARARSFFRYPSLDAAGHRAMRMEGVIGYRTAEYPGPVVYAARRTDLAAAAAFLEPDLIGHAQQALADHQVLNRIEQRVEPSYVEQLLRLPEQYVAISEAPLSPHRLPMSPGQPDAVFADEDAGVVAVRRGAEILYAALFRRAIAMTGVARVHHVQNDLERVATVEVDVEFATDGEFWTRPDVVDWMPGGSSFEPEERPRQAFAGERALLARAPVDASDVRPFSAKAAFYRLHYGNYLIGMNASTEQSYELRPPLGVISAEDVATGKLVELPVIVEPRSTRVLYLAAGPDRRPRPFAPRFLTTTRDDGRIVLDWDPVSGATSYRVERALRPSGPYTTLATRVDESTFWDQSVSEDQVYFYTVVAENGYGSSARSPELRVAELVP